MMVLYRLLIRVVWSLLMDESYSASNPYKHSNGYGTRTAFYDENGIHKCPECGEELGNDRRIYCPINEKNCRKVRQYRKQYESLSDKNRKAKRVRCKKWYERMRDGGRCTRCGEDANGRAVCWGCMFAVDLKRTR